MQQAVGPLLAFRDPAREEEFEWRFHNTRLPLDRVYLSTAVACDVVLVLLKLVPHGRWDTAVLQLLDALPAAVLLASLHAGREAYLQIRTALIAALQVVHALVSEGAAVCLSRLLPVQCLRRTMAMRLATCSLCAPTYLQARPVSPATPPADLDARAAPVACTHVRPRQLGPAAVLGSGADAPAGALDRHLRLRTAAAHQVRGERSAASTAHAGRAILPPYLPLNSLVARTTHSDTQTKAPAPPTQHRHAVWSQAGTAGMLLLPPFAAQRLRVSLQLCPTAGACYSRVAALLSAALAKLLPPPLAGWIAAVQPLPDAAAYYLLTSMVQVLASFAAPLLWLAVHEWRARLEFARSQRDTAAVASLRRLARQWQLGAIKGGIYAAALGCIALAISRVAAFIGWDTVAL